MARLHDNRTTSRIRQARSRNTVVRARAGRRAHKPHPRGHVGTQNIRAPFAPPEDWYDPTGASDYSVRVCPPGAGYRHVLTPAQIRDRLAQLPARFVAPLEVVQLSCMTRKKQSFPCYGMQWGTTVYLYPLEESLVETFYRPPLPDLYNESRMFGGQWKESPHGIWTLHWSMQAIQDFYLNNILMHELGHLLDDRNSGYADRERFAEWFAIEHGYRATGRHRRRKAVRRRHHAV
jgi:hypothetical protein